MRGKKKTFHWLQIIGVTGALGAHRVNAKGKIQVAEGPSMPWEKVPTNGERHLELIITVLYLHIRLLLHYCRSAISNFQYSPI